MADLSTTYLGLLLKSPIIVGSCGLTSTIEKNREIEKYGAGAIVLKSIFEEEILLESEDFLREMRNNPMVYSSGSESLDYIDIHTREKKLNDYLKLIRECKRWLEIPIIASINCVTDQLWTGFANRIQEAGADAIELNIFHNPATFKEIDTTKLSLSIMNKVLAEVKIPVAVKLSDHDANLAHNMVKYSKSGIGGLVMFNRFYTPDFDIDTFATTGSHPFSHPSEYLKPLRWISLLSGRVNCSLSASTGIHNAEAIIKQILAGADTVQLASALYINGVGFIDQLNQEIREWMMAHEMYALSQFRGRLSYLQNTSPDQFERMQFMKRFSDIG